MSLTDGNVDNTPQCSRDHDSDFQSNEKKKRKSKKQNVITLLNHTARSFVGLGIIKTCLYHLVFISEMSYKRNVLEAKPTKADWH